MTRLEDPRLHWTVLGVAMVLYAALALRLMRGTTLFVDEINVFTADRGFHPSALLAPLNGHLVLFQRLLFAVDFKLFGASFVLPRLVEVTGVALVVGLFFALARQRVGAAAALAPAILLLFLGSVWELNFVVSGIGNVYAAAAGLAAVLALQRGARGGDLFACAMLVVAVGAFTTGVAFAIGAAVLILLSPRAGRRLWVVLVPLALYAAWLIWVRAEYVPTHGEVQGFRLSNVLLIPNYIADEGASVAGVIAGLNYDFRPESVLDVFSTGSQYGPVLAALAVAALVIRLRRRPARPELWACLAMLLALWVALALGFGEGRNPTTIRYAYGGAVLVLLLAAEAARGVRLSASGVLALYAIVLLALGGNLARLRDGSRFYRQFTTSLRAELTALELARGSVAPSFARSSQTSGLAPIPLGPYLAAVDRNGSPAYPVAELPSRPERERQAADVVLVQALRIGLTAPAADDRTRPCRRLRGLTGPSVSFPVPAPGARLEATAPGRVTLRRFATVATVRVGSLIAGRPADLRLPRDRSPRPWWVSVSPAPPSLTACPLRER